MTDGFWQISVPNPSDIYYSLGNVGIGTTSPQANLDVAGDIRPGSSGVVEGGACANEGALAYDVTAHKPVYCNNDSPTKHWASMGGAGLGVGQSWQDLTSSRARDVVITNFTGKPIEVVISITYNNAYSAGYETVVLYVDNIPVASATVTGLF